jgi:hypothetical protein
MNTRHEAIVYFEGLGFSAKERDWSFGQTIVVHAGLRKSSTPYVWTSDRSVCLYPRDGSWSIYDMNSAHPVADERRMSLQEACDAAVQMLKHESKA